MKVVQNRKHLPILFVVCLLLISSCSADNDGLSNLTGNVCQPNATRVCTCPNGRSGLETCINGQAYSACECDESEAAGDASMVGVCAEGQTAVCTCPDGSSGTKECLSNHQYSGCKCNTTDNSTDSSVAVVDSSVPVVDSAFTTTDSAVVDPFDGGNTTDGNIGLGGDSSGTTDSGGPVVSISGIQCGPAQGLNTAPVSIGGRDVLINYPCNKPEGTKVTFILILHGTQADENLKFYQHAYLGSFKYVDTHNFIVASPKSVVSQWGNGDGGRDRPHIMEVIDWVYNTFSAFDIASMWVAGHSWGAMYSRGFVCELQQSRGVILQSGGPEMPLCADRLSVITSVGETDIVPGLPEQSLTALAHGCDGASISNLGNNTVTAWPNCDPGWVHKNYFMLGKGHGFVPTDFPDEDVTQDIADAILSAL